ncbi:MAG: DUF4242 domain-containing protein [Dehalococcoidia bacterium]
MQKYLIEREVAGAGQLSVEELRTVSQTSLKAANQLGPQIQWVQSYITGDKIYCVYIAANEEIVREHAQLAGIPVNCISEIRSLADPTTAER